MIVKEWCSFCGVREYALVFDEGDCKDCDTCIKACPINALEKEE